MSCGNSDGGKGNNSVKRNLFGDVDHAQIKDDLNKQLAISLREKSRQWNFDFEEFKPLPHGRYKWERVGKRLEHVTTSTRTRSCATSSQFNADENHESCQDLQQNRAGRYNLRNRNSQRQNNPRCILKPVVSSTPRKRLQASSQSLTRQFKQGSTPKKLKNKQRRAVLK